MYRFVKLKGFCAGDAAQRRSTDNGLQPVRMHDVKKNSRVCNIAAQKSVKQQDQER